MKTFLSSRLRTVPLLPDYARSFGPRGRVRTRELARPMKLSESVAMPASSSALAYSVRLRIVAKFLGLFSLALAALTSVPLVVSIGFGEYDITQRYGISLGVLLLLSLLARLPAPDSIQRNEAMVVAALVFLLAPFLTAYTLKAPDMAFEDALFESISAVTTTGLTTLDSMEGRPDTFLFSRAWIQWYGGLGILVVSVGVILTPGKSSLRLSSVEDNQDDLLGGSNTYARWVLAIYSLMTVLGVLVVWATGLGLYDSFLLVMASVSTGGFAPQDASLAALDSLTAQAAVSLVCVAGAVPFVAYIRIARRQRGSAFHVPLRHLLIPGVLLLAPSVFLFLTMGTNGLMSWSDAAVQAPLTAVSAQTTSGFSTIPIASLDDGSKLGLILTMFVGGGSGSTAGGIKFVRLLIIFSAFIHLIRFMGLPSHAVNTRTLRGKKLEAGDVEKALCLVLFFATVVVVSWIPFVLCGYDPLDSLFDVVSATGTVGISSGVTDGSLPVALKGLLCANMLLGRLEIIAWLVLFAPRTWFGPTYRS